MDHWALYQVSLLSIHYTGTAWMVLKQGFHACYHPILLGDFGATGFCGKPEQRSKMGKANCHVVSLFSIKENHYILKYIN